MRYDDNPRKVYGKVEIIFSDSDISSISSVVVTDNATISHPEEVYKEAMGPTVKACTMDGNATMGGGYQMMDDTCTIGWWGKDLSDEEGIFENYPTIEITFTERPIVSWIITGDTKLGEFPTNFLVQYLRGDIVIDYKEVLDNTLVQYRLVKTVLGVTGIRLAVYKWNKPNACVKLMRFFDTLIETYDESDLQAFELNEELCSEDASFNLNSDSMSVTIYNKEGKFTRGYLQSLLILDRKVKPYIGIESNGTINYIPLGTFYSEEWKVSDDGRLVTCTAIDKLMRLQNITYIGLSIQFVITLYDIAVDIFTKVGIPPSKYEISTALENFIIGDAFMPKSSVWDALQQIAYNGLCNIYIDRNDKIIISSIDDVAPYSTVELVRDNTFSYISNISLTEFANKVLIEYAENDLGDVPVDALNTSIKLAASEELEIIIDYITEVTYATLTCDNPKINVASFVGGTNACKVKLINTTSIDQEGNITIKGPKLTINYKTISVQDDISVRNYGAFEYKHPTSIFIQDKYKATEVATKLLNRMKAGEGTFKTVWRGNPNLELGDRYNFDRGPGEENDFICEYNKFSFDGGLKQETRGRKITGGN